MTEPAMLDCRDAMRQLFDYLDGELDAARRTAVRHHLERCRGCFGHHDFYATFVAALGAARVEEPAPEMLRARLLEALAAEGFRRPGQALP